MTTTSSAVNVTSLEYVGFETLDLDRMVDHYTEMLDFTVVEMNDEPACLTTDFRHQSVVIQKSPMPLARPFVGFRLAEDSATAQLRLKDAGHVAAFTPDLVKTQDFYEGSLRFPWSDTVADFSVFLRCNSDHQAANFMASTRRTGMHHIAFEYADLDRWLDNYVRLKADGTLSFLNLDHGMTMSMYHADPEGNGVEIQVDAFGDWAKSREWVWAAEGFGDNPIGAHLDPDKIVDARSTGLNLPGYTNGVDSVSMSLPSSRRYSFPSCGESMTPIDRTQQGAEYLRIANLLERAVLISDDRGLDIAAASGRRFGPNISSVWLAWTEFEQWALTIPVSEHPDARPYKTADLAAPNPSPSQIFAIGLNYADHAKEAGLSVPAHPLVFTKFTSSLVGPQSVVRRSSDRVDWEAELVVVMGTGGRDIAVADAWSAIAGPTVGQDISDRSVQSWGAPSAQFALGKSASGAVETVQDGNTSNLIIAIPQLSQIVELRPGDLIFTGTPVGVGIGRTPQIFLKPGNHLTTTIEGIGSIRQEFV